MQHDTNKIRNTISLYFKGTYTGDAKLLKEAFHQDAHISGTINSEYHDWSLTDFITRVVNHPTAAEKNEIYDKKIILIDSIGDIAMAKARVAIADYIFTDYISLIKINNQWYIRNKLFTSLKF